MESAAIAEEANRGENLLKRHASASDIKRFLDSSLLSPCKSSPPPAKAPRREDATSNGHHDVSLDRSAFLSRLSTFRPGRWPAFGPVSPLECARLGWELSDVDLLRCVTCGATVCGRLASSADPAVFRASAERLRGRLREAHARFCPWHRLASPEHFCRLPEAMSAEEACRKARDLVRDLGEDLMPRIASRALKRLSDEEEEVLRKLALAVGGDQDLAFNALMLCLHGWAAQGPQGVRVLACGFCNKRCATWTYGSCRDKDVEEKEEEPTLTEDDRRQIALEATEQLVREEVEEVAKEVVEELQKEKEEEEEARAKESEGVVENGHFAAPDAVVSSGAIQESFHGREAFTATVPGDQQQQQDLLSESRRSTCGSDITDAEDRIKAVEEEAEGADINKEEDEENYNSSQEQSFREESEAPEEEVGVDEQHGAKEEVPSFAEAFSCVRESLEKGGEHLSQSRRSTCGSDITDAEERIKSVEEEEGERGNEADRDDLSTKEEESVASKEGAEKEQESPAPLILGSFSSKVGGGELLSESRRSTCGSDLTDSEDRLKMVEEEEEEEEGESDGEAASQKGDEEVEDPSRGPEAEPVAQGPNDDAEGESLNKEGKAEESPAGDEKSIPESHAGEEAAGEGSGDTSKEETESHDNSQEALKENSRNEEGEGEKSKKAEEEPQVAGEKASNDDKGESEEEDVESVSESQSLQEQSVGSSEEPTRSREEEEEESSSVPPDSSGQTGDFSSSQVFASSSQATGDSEAVSSQNPLASAKEAEEPASSSATAEARAAEAPSSSVEEADNVSSAHDEGAGKDEEEDIEEEEGEEEGEDEEMFTDEEDSYGDDDDDEEVEEDYSSQLSEEASIVRMAAAAALPRNESRDSDVVEILSSDEEEEDSGRQVPASSEAGASSQDAAAEEDKEEEGGDNVMNVDGQFDFLPSSKKKRRTAKFFNPVSEHLPWCPWRSGLAEAIRVLNKTEEEASSAVVDMVSSADRRLSGQDGLKRVRELLNP